MQKQVDGCVVNWGIGAGCSVPMQIEMVVRLA